jgi:taurine dioxygenase
LKLAVVVDMAIEPAHYGNAGSSQHMHTPVVRRFASLRRHLLASTMTPADQAATSLHSPLAVAHTVAIAEIEPTETFTQNDPTGLVAQSTEVLGRHGVLVLPLGPGFAAEVNGLQPPTSGQPAHPELIAGLRHALAAHKVLCIRGELLAEDSFQELIKLFGPLHVKGGRDKDGKFFEYAATVGKMDNSTGRHTGENYGANFYHTDTCFVDQPPRCTVLHARRMPPSGGGDTGFLDAVVGYETLPTEMKARLEGVRSIHGWNNDRLFGKGGGRAKDSNQNDLVNVEHPIVRTHAVTGQRALFINLARNKGVVGMGLEDGVKLLQELQDHMQAHAPKYRHVYREGDCLIWDNSLVQHRCHENWVQGEPRVLWQLMVAGEKPL